MASSYRKPLEAMEARAAALATRIAETWQERAVEVLGAPLPKELDLDSLPELIRTLARAAYSGADDPAPEELIRVAIKHGVDRRSSGYADNIVFREYHLLRRYLWDELKKSEQAQDAIVAAILRIDAAMTTATAASAHGFHLEDKEIDQERLVKRLLKDWTMPL
ncbi:MAG TPA: hypothetical protein VF039_03100 [Longimicrobiales bacterium]